MRSGDVAKMDGEACILMRVSNLRYVAKLFSRITSPCALEARSAIGLRTPNLPIKEKARAETKPALSL